jgi:hypothetical protein
VCELGRIPEFALAVYVERAFLHCPKCMVRSKLWQLEAWPDHTGLAAALNGVRHFAILRRIALRSECKTCQRGD